MDYLFHGYEDSSSGRKSAVVLQRRQVGTHPEFVELQAVCPKTATATSNCAAEVQPSDVLPPQRPPRAAAVAAPTAKDPSPSSSAAMDNSLLDNVHITYVLSSSSSAWSDDDDELVSTTRSSSSSSSNSTAGGAQKPLKEPTPTPAAQPMLPLLPVHGRILQPRPAYAHHSLSSLLKMPTVEEAPAIPSTHHTKVMVLGYDAEGHAYVLALPPHDASLAQRYTDAYILAQRCDEPRRLLERFVDVTAHEECLYAEERRRQQTGLGISSLCRYPVLTLPTPTSYTMEDMQELEKRGEVQRADADTLSDGEAPHWIIHSPPLSCSELHVMGIPVDAPYTSNRLGHLRFVGALAGMPWHVAWQDGSFAGMARAPPPRCDPIPLPSLFVSHGVSTSSADFGPAALQACLAHCATPCSTPPPPVEWEEEEASATSGTSVPSPPPPAVFHRTSEDGLVATGPFGVRLDCDASLTATSQFGVVHGQRLVAAGAGQVAESGIALGVCQGSLVMLVDGESKAKVLRGLRTAEDVLRHYKVAALEPEATVPTTTQPTADVEEHRDEVAPPVIAASQISVTAPEVGPAHTSEPRRESSSSSSDACLIQDDVASSSSTSSTESATAGAAHQAAPPAAVAAPLEAASRDAAAHHHHRPADHHAAPTASAPANSSAPLLRFLKAYACHHYIEQGIEVHADAVPRLQSYYLEDALTRVRAAHQALANCRLAWSQHQLPGVMTAAGKSFDDLSVEEMMEFLIMQRAMA